MTYRQLVKQWTNKPTNEILEQILDEIDWGAVLKDITNESDGSNFLHFFACITILIRALKAASLNELEKFGELHTNM